MVEESIQEAYGVSIIHWRPKLVRVPCQVNIEGWYCDLGSFGKGHYGEVTAVFGKETFHRKSSDW